jgi:hypothetical protein
VQVVRRRTGRAHQFVSPAKYFAADRRMSRSVDERDRERREEADRRFNELNSRGGGQGAIWSSATSLDRLR